MNGGVGELLLIPGQFVGRRGEFERAVEARGFGAQAAGEHEEPGCGNVLEITAGEFLADLRDVLGERFQAAASGDFAVFRERFGFDRTEVAMR